MHWLVPIYISIYVSTWEILSGHPIRCKPASARIMAEYLLSSSSFLNLVFRFPRWSIVKELLKSFTCYENFFVKKKKTKDKKHTRQKTHWPRTMCSLCKHFRKKLYIFRYCYFLFLSAKYITVWKGYDIFKFEVWELPC